jgi:hypothetical protein
VLPNSTHFPASDDAFTVQDVSVFEVLASLLATSIQNTVLYQKLDEELKKAKTELRQYTRVSWDKYVKG